MKKALEKLAEFAPKLDPKYMKSEGNYGYLVPKGKDEHLWVHTSLGNVQSDFIDMVHKENWVEPFDWGAWVKTDEGKSLVENPSALKGATIDQLSKVITAYVRQDRFCEGVLLEAFRSGYFYHVALRAQKLLEA